MRVGHCRIKRKRMAKRIENIFYKFPSLPSCFHGCTNVHSIHDRTPLSCPPKLSERRWIHSPTGFGSVGSCCGLVSSHRRQRIHAMGQHMSPSKRHSGLPPSCRVQGIHVPSAAFTSISWMHSYLPCSFLGKAMSNDTKNAGIGYLLSIVIVIAAASLPSLVL